MTVPPAAKTPLAAELRIVDVSRALERGGALALELRHELHMPAISGRVLRKHDRDIVYGGVAHR